MKIEKKSSNCWRVRKTISKKTVSLYFDHEPSDVDIAKALAKELNVIDTKSVNQTFEVCATEYISIKYNVLSPSTIRSYNAIIKGLSDSFKKKDINSITQIDIQMEINSLSKKRSAKTISNYHGFISAVLGMFRPNMTINTTLPQKIKYEGYLPTEDEVRMILSKAEGTKYHIPFQLGVLGMRRSEVCAATLNDIKGNSLSINKAKVEGEDGLVLKPLTKTTEGKRDIYIPDSLIEQINDNGAIFDGFPSMLIQTLHRYQQELNIPKFRFHDLRVFYASYAHSCGVPDTVIMANGGWASDYTMKKHYRKALQQDVEYYQKAISDDLFKSRDNFRDN